MKSIEPSLKTAEYYAQQAASAIKAIVKERPGVSLVAAIAVGGIVGWLIKRRR